MNLRLPLITAALAFTAYSFTALAGEKSVSIDGANYLGIGYSDHQNELTAKEDACNAARREVMGHVFGAGYEINQNLIRSLGGIDYSQDVAVNSGKVILRGTTSETVKEGDITRCRLSYPLLEATAETKRLSDGTRRELHFTELGSAENTRGGVLEIVSQPPDVPVQIDNIPYGKTPVRLYGQLVPGQHKIRLDDPNYQPVEKTIVVGSHGKQRVDEILRRATGKISITTTANGQPLSETKIYVDDQLKGVAPSEVEVPAGRKLKIRLSHPEAEDTTQAISISRDDSKRMNVDLLLKPAYVSFNIDPPENQLQVTVDGASQAGFEPNQFIEVEARKSHTLSIQKNGYEPYQTSFVLAGGEKRPLDTIRLQKLAYLLLTIHPKGPVSIRIDDELPIDSNGDKPMGLRSGTHSLTIEKEGFDTFHTTVELERGYTKPLMVTLDETKLERSPAYIAPSTSQDYSDPGFRDGAKSLLGFELIAGQGTYAAFSSMKCGYLNAFYELSLSRYFGVNLGLFAGGGYQKYSDAELKSTDLGIRGSLPLYFWNTSGGASYFIEPRVIFTLHNFQVTPLNGAVLNSSSGQTAYGGGIGRRVWMNGGDHPAALTLQIDYDRYSTSSGGSGNSSLSFKLGVAWGL